MKDDWQTETGQDDYSIGEIAGLIQKAYRGIGRPWGLAEEAGRAADWLASRGLPGPDMFALLTRRFDGTDCRDCTPIDLTGPWKAPGSGLCPVIAGSSFCDAPMGVREPGGLSMHAVVAPLLILPFAAAVAGRTGWCLAVEWPGVKAVCAPGGYRIHAAAGDLVGDMGNLTLSVTRADGNVSGPGRQRVQCSKATFETLDHFAHRTYVPETELSRLKGAGAGLTDND